MDVHDRVDPAVARALESFPIDTGNLRREDLPAIRSMSATLAAVSLSDAVDRADHVAAGKVDVTMRVLRPKDGTYARPCVYWMHGGGYMVGSYRADEADLDVWCEHLDCVVVSVEYRLAPEHPYPAPLDDCSAGLRWVYDHADEIGVDPTRIGIAGASAGGGLAAALALFERDQGTTPIAFQLLMFPMVDDRQTTPSSQWDAPIWPPSANRLGWDCYLGDLNGGSVPAYAAPARATDLGGLPPALVVVGAVDGFLDEDIDYARRLIHAGVPTELRVYPGAPHGFTGLASGTALARRARADIEDWLRRAFGEDVPGRD